MAKKTATARGQIEDFRWFLPEYEGERWPIVTRLINDLRHEQRGRIEADVLHMALYSGKESMASGLASYWQGVDRYEGDLMARLGVNLCKTAVKALHSKIGKSRPKPTVTTDEGDFEMVLRAEALQRFLDGAFYESGVFKKDLRLLLQTLVIGTSHMKIYRGDDPTDPEDDPRIEVSIPIPGAIVVDDLEAIDGKPRSIHEIGFIDKYVLAEQCDKKFRKAIIDAPEPKEGLRNYGYHRRTNQIVVIESWHLRSGKRAKDGRHTICIDGADLRDEVYDRDKFPFVKLDYDEELVGYYGTGIAFQALGYQSEINDLLLKGQKIIHLAGVPHVLCPNGALVNQDTWTNEILTFINYEGPTPPTIVMPTNLVGEIMQQAGTFREWFFQDVSISQMMAQSEKPPGVDAAVALEALSDMDTEHHVLFGRRYEDAHMEMAEHFIEVAKDINKGNKKAGHVPKKYQVTWRGTDTIERLDWADVEMDKDSAVIQVLPSSMLGNTIAGRLQRGTELLKLGALSLDQFLEVLDIADIKRATSDRRAALRYLQKVCVQILKHGNYIGPEPDDNHDLAATVMLAALQKAKTSNVPEARLQMFRDYLLELKNMTQPAGAEAAPALPTLAPGIVPPGGAPGVPPMLPPAPGGPPMPPMPLPPAGGAPPGGPIH